MYLLVADYFSRFPEVIQLSTTTSSSVIQTMKAIFARHGVPEQVVTNHGPQYASREMKEFASSYGFCHITSSPLHPQGNGHAERMVQTVKRLLQDADDSFMALLNYRSTPFPSCGLSPSELLYGRHLRTTLPQLDTKLIPAWPYLSDFRCNDQKLKQQQKIHYDRRHRTRLVPPLEEGSQVWITSGDQHTKGTIASEANTPRSYIVNTPSGQLRRNRRHLTSSVDQTLDACVSCPAQPIEKPEDAAADVTNEAECSTVANLSPSLTLAAGAGKKHL